MVYTQHQIHQNKMIFFYFFLSFLHYFHFFSLQNIIFIRHYLVVNWLFSFTINFIKVLDYFDLCLQFDSYLE
jgi:hypothetical protein